MNLIPQNVKHTIHNAKNNSEYDKSTFAEASADKHAGHSVNVFARKFWISLVLTIPVLLYSELPKRFFGWTAPEFPGSDYLSLILGSIIFFYGGMIFLQNAFRELRARLPGMMTLIALAITVAYAYSATVVFIPGSHTLFWESATLITIMLLGHWVEMRAVQGAQGALKELSKLLPDKAEVIRDGEIKMISIKDLGIGDIIVIKPGAKVPADGIVVDGRSEINEAMITGESRPVLKIKDTEIIAGTINSGDGMLRAKVSKIGASTFLAGVMRLVAQAQASKSRLQLLSDRAAYYLTLVAVGAGMATFFAWSYYGQNVAFAVTRTVAVLVIACPHALGLAIPLVASISTSLAATKGFLVKKRSALELARNIDTVIFDKTGTLTKGEFGVESVILNENAAYRTDEDGLLRIVASVDANSEHFVSMAIVKKAKEKNLELFETKEFKRLPGLGVSGIVDGYEVMAGGEALIADREFSLSEEFINRKRELAAKGKTIIYVIIGQDLAGAIILGDVIREESREAVNGLKKLGKKVVMLTGDSEEVAQWAAKELGINEFFAKVLPQNKVEKIKFLQNEGRKVAMVGDGINDAPALTQADLGIAIGAGTNIAVESAGIILVRNNPRDVVKIIDLSKETYSKMLQNLFWATGYNVIALPLAAGVLAPKGILLEPAFSAVLMSLSTVIVALNALLLRSKKL